ncbi:MAG: alpha/beta fold hydrolase, partial [Pedobacter sp.]
QREQMLGAMAYLAPQPLSTALPKLVPKLSQTLSDPHPKVQAAARQALREVSDSILIWFEARAAQSLQAKLTESTSSAFLLSTCKTECPALVISLPNTVATLPEPMSTIFINSNFGKMKIQQKLAIGYIRNKLNVQAMLNKSRAAEKAFELFCTPLSRYTGKGSEVFLQSEKLSFDFEGNTVRGFRCNHPQDKKALILHGFSSSCHKFDHYAKAFIQKGFEVLAFDAPAHGASDGKTINALQYSEVIEKIVMLYGPVDVFLCHSLGGLAASLALEKIPHNEQTKLILIAPATETTSAINNAFSFLGLKNTQLRSELDEVIKRISGHDTGWFSIRRAIRNICASVLWIHDEDDDVTPLEDALKVKEDAPSNVQFMVTKGLGHRQVYRDGTVKDRVLAFL